MRPVVVVIEDDQDIAQFLQQVLVDHQYEVYVKYTGSSGLELVSEVIPDVVLLDLNLPDINGESICRQIKQLHPEIIVIMITAKDTPEEIAKGLDLGADDYLPKPISPKELMARIRTRLRSTEHTKSELEIGDLIMNTDTHQVKRGQKEIDLSPQEFRLLHYFMMNPNRVLSREMILSRIWGTSPDIETRVVDVYVGYLRRKIDQEFDQKLLESVRGFGYMLKEHE